MNKEVDIHTGETWIQLSDEEIKFGFLSQCIEALAQKESCDYIDMLDRMEKADMTTGYILSFYDVLHTESWDNVISDLSKLLYKRESQTL